MRENRILSFLAWLSLFQIEIGREEKDPRSTSSAAHYINGNLIHSSSRTQHVVSLSSTEVEYYAMTSTCTDTIYVKHILEFLLSREVEAQVKVDNSATRQISNKLGTSKLSHVRGTLYGCKAKSRMEC